MKARQTTDDAFNAALQLLANSANVEHRSATAQLNNAQAQLKRARQDVERVSALPQAERSSGANHLIRATIEQMFAVIDTALESVTILSADAERVYPDLSQPLVGARLAAELRENAGRLGSQFAAPIGAPRALGPEEWRDIPVLIGRIDQLRHLIEVQARANAADSRVTAAILEMKSRYFAVGLPFIGQLMTAGLNGNDYGVDLTTFVARYVPEMASIVTLRDTMFEVARGGANDRYAQARRDLAINSAIGLLVLLIEITVFLLIRWRVLKPLLDNTHAVVAIAEGKLDTPLHASTRSDEIGDMQNAVAKLKQTSVDKQKLEGERDRLIEQLQHTSTVDYLTNLLNRRAFGERITQQLALAQRNRWAVALIVFDIDHFKLINDHHGHAAGDDVLTQIAAIAQREFRATDTLARYGGEEFIALLIHCSRDDAVAFAERLRIAIAQAPFTAGSSTPHQVTASFGVVSAAATDIPDTTAFFQSADKALYQAKAEGRNRVAVA